MACPQAPNAAGREAWTQICPPHPVCPPSPLAWPSSPCPPTFLTPICPPSSLPAPHHSPRSTLRPSASLNPCPFLTPFAHLTPVRPPHPSARLSPRPPSSPVCSSHPSAHLTRPPTSPLSAHPAHGPPSSPWSKCLMRLRRPTFPWGSASRRCPPWSRSRGPGAAQSG